MSEDGKTTQNDWTNRDRLSNLPENVLDKILVKLPLKAAIRTSILSKQWRFKWGHLSSFAIEFNCRSSVYNERAKSFVYRYLLYHNNEIDMFKLSGTCQLSSNLGAWIHILSLKVVKKLVIFNCHLRSPYAELPPSLFSFQHLECLEVMGYKIKVPRTFGGFSSLTILHLSEVFIDSEELQILTNKCHALQRLKLSSTIAVTKFVVDNCRSWIPCFELPPSLLSFQHLECLEVIGYKIKVPPTFEGFSSLTILHLTDVFIGGKELQILTSKCHALKRLKLSSTISVEKFVANNCHSWIPCFELPPSLPCFQQLKFLEVNGYKIKVPFWFGGFRSLCSLHLADVLIDGKELEILVNNCRFLESLKLSSIQRLRDWTIHVLKLKYLEIVSTTENIRFSATGNLLSANLTLNDKSVISRKIFTALCDPTDLVRPSPIEIFKVVDLKDEKEIFSLKHAHLSRVCVDGPLNLNDINDVRVFLSILGGFPNLKELHFSVSGCFESPDNYKFPEDLQPLNFSKLQVVSVQYNSHLSILAEFLHLIMGRSHRIGTLEITKCFQPQEKIKEHGKKKSFKKRFRKKFRRLKEVSPLVKIIYKEKKICPSS